MTELVQSVRLQYDGAGAVAAIGATTKAVDDLAGAAKSVGPASAGVATLGDAASAAAKTAGTASAGVAALGADARTAGAAIAATTVQTEGLAKAAASVGGAGGGIAALAPAMDAAAASGGALAAANDRGVTSATRYNAASIVLQSAVRKTSDQFAAGAPIATIFAEHIGTLGEVLELYATQRAAKAEAASAALGAGAVAAGAEAGVLGTALEAVTGFLAGPWAIALPIAAAVLGPLVGNLLDTESAADKAKHAVDDFTDDIRKMGDGIDAQTGKLDSFNEKLALSARLQAAATRPELQGAITDGTKAIFDAAQSAQTKAGAKAIGGSLTLGLGANVANNVDVYEEIGDALAKAGGNAQSLVANITRLAATDPNLRPLAKTLADQNISLQENVAKLAEAGAAEARYDLVAQGGTLQTKQTVEAEIERRTATDASARATANLTAARAALTAVEEDYLKLGPTKDATSALEAAKNQVVAAQKAVDAIQSAPRARAPTKAPDLSGLDTSVANDIRNFNAEFTDTPGFVEKVRAALDKLDQDAATLEKKKPPNYQSLLDQIGRTKGLIEDNLSKPFDDFLKTQSQSFQVSQLLAQGHTDEAVALREVFALQHDMGPLTQAQKDAVLDTVQALRAEQEQQEKLNASRQQDVQALGQVKDEIAGVFAGSEKLKSLPGDLLKSFRQLSGEQLADKLFGGAFSQLKDQASGVAPIEDASAKMASALEQLRAPVVALAPRITDAQAPIVDLGNAATDTAAALRSIGSGGVAGSGGVSTGAVSAAQVQSLSSDAQDFLNVNPDLFPGEDVGQITVTAAKKQAAAADDFMDAVTLYNKSGETLFAQLDRLLGANGVFASIGANLGTALQGASYGSTASSVFSSITGTKSSTTGSSIGGGIGDLAGSALGGPLGGAIGSVLGGIAGGLLGGLFQSVKKSSATIDFSAGAASVGQVTGTSASRKSTATEEAGGVIDSLSDVADQLDGVLSGLGSVSIGTRNKKFVVDTSGSGRTKGSGVEKYDSEQDAESAALADAIADGAIGGISAAMQKALASSSDTSKGVAEALKVRDVQDVLTGLGTDLLSSFRDFESQAKERVRIAQQYGFDVNQIEEYNAQQRQALIDSSLKQSVGSLQDLLTNLATGDLSEGDAVTKRNALLDQIASARSDADAGKDGAADTLASLLQNLVSSDKDAFGTAGPELSADRTLAQTAAEATIKAENDRITAADAAVGTTNATLATANQLADENNGQNAQIIAKLDQLIALGARGGGGKGPDLSLATRAASL